MKILALESSAKAASVAVTEDGCLLGECFVNTPRTHSETLLPLCASLLDTLQLCPSDIEAYAVAAGPGSFTGLRIGIATVKGMMAADHKRCAPVSTLLALAYNLIGTSGLVCAAMDARCNQVYQALFRVDGEQVIRLTEDRAVMISQLEQELSAWKEPITLVGDGAALCTKKMSLDTLRIAPERIRHQRASSVALAASQMTSGAFLCGADLAPVYLRLPQAERERLARSQTKAAN